MVSGRSVNQLDHTGNAVTGSRARPRAAALPPEARRAAIIDATVVLLIAHGTTITTRQIAEAAGIAEGTIFRVFADKESLIAAAIDQAFDPAPVDAELRAIDATLPLESRLEAAVDILRRRFIYIGRLMSAVGMFKPPGDETGKASRRDPPTLQALAEVIAPDRDRLSRDPMAAAQLLRGLTFVGTHPALLVEEPLPTSEIVSVLLDGIRNRPGVPC